MNCPNACNVEMESKKVEKLYHKDGKRFIIKDLIILICPECGEEAIPLSSMKIVDSIIQGKMEASELVEAPVYKVM